MWVWVHVHRVDSLSGWVGLHRPLAPSSIEDGSGGLDHPTTAGRQSHRRAEARRRDHPPPSHRQVADGPSLPHSNRRDSRFHKLSPNFFSVALTVSQRLLSPHASGICLGGCNRCVVVAPQMKTRRRQPDSPPGTVVFKLAPSRTATAAARGRANPTDDSRPTDPRSRRRPEGRRGA